MTLEQQTVHDLSKWREDIKAAVEERYSTILPPDAIEATANYWIEFLTPYLSRVIGEMEESPESMRIPCPEGKIGCLVIHYGPEILTVEQTARNKKLSSLRETIGIQEP